MAGISNFENYQFGNPEYVCFYDDFITTIDTTNVWSVVKDSGASVAIGTDASNGTVLLSSAATTDDDGALLQSIQEYIVLEANKTVAVETKVKVSDATQSEFYFGLAAQAATDPENILTAASRVGFVKADGSTELSAVVTASSVTLSTSCQQQMADNTYVYLSIYWDGTSAYFYVNGSQVASYSTGLPVDEMAIALFSLSGNNSGTKVCTADFISMMKDR